MDNLFDLEGLEDVVVGALLHGVDGRLDRAEARHDHGECFGVRAGDCLEQLQTTHFRHLQIADHHVVTRSLELVHGALAVVGGAHDVSLHAEKVGEDVADELLVVDDEYPRLFVRRSRFSFGHQLGLAVLS